MSEGIKAALITGGFMVMVINEIAFLLREKRIRKKELFKEKPVFGKIVHRDLPWPWG